MAINHEHSCTYIDARTDLYKNQYKLLDAGNSNRIAIRKAKLQRIRKLLYGASYLTAHSCRTCSSSRLKFKPVERVPLEQ